MKSGSEKSASASPWRSVWQRFKKDPLAVGALCALVLLMLLALLAPLLANPRALLAYTPGDGLSMPFLRSFFAPESTEFFIEKLFNFALLALLPSAIILLAVKKRLVRKLLLAGLLLLLMLPFVLVKPKLERVDRSVEPPAGSWQINALLPYGPFEQISKPYTPPGKKHPLGCDELGRDLAVRVIYGSRISLAVGLLATTLAMIIGIAVGVSTGYLGGWIDMITMRLVEILMCFPVFLLLLIVMSYFQEYKFEQSILAVTGILALTGWIGTAQLTRGEVLKQREMVYVKAAQALGVSRIGIIFKHILPNIAGTVMIAFSFGVAGAILSESALSFLSFGVQPPTASWGGMLRTAYGDPLSAWHMTVFPGLMLFWAVAGFNLLGEGLRKALDPNSSR